MRTPTALLPDDVLEQRIRHSLTTVAATVTGDPVTAARTPRRSRRWRIGLGIGVAAIPIALAASAVVRQGPEYVDTIPPGDIITRGSVDGSSWLLVESRRTDDCGPVTGVELVEERENLLGSEWSTIGSRYGDLDATACVTPARWLADPSLFDDGGTAVGDSFVWIWAVHPDVTAVRITARGDTDDLPVHSVDGAGYALYEVPSDLDSYTAELVIDDAVVPGTFETQAVPQR